MHWKRLQTFVKIVELRSFTDAAALLGVTPSAISKQIKVLEEELHSPLFHRNCVSVEPTSAGKLVYERSKLLIDEWERLVTECRSLSQTPSGRLRIGASTVPASYLLPAIIRRLLERYPHIELSVTEDDSASVLTRLEQRAIDVAFVGSSRPSPALQFTTITTDTLVIVGADPNASNWKQAPFVMREEGSGTRKALMQALDTLGLDASALRIVAVSSSTESALALVEAGVGVTAVSRWALALPRNVSVLAELPTNRRFYAAFESTRSEDTLVRLFLQIASEIYP
jgi:DNA-binding transcriptional LysR family regulator